MIGKNLEKTLATLEEKDLKRKLAEYVSERIGRRVGEDHVHSDENGWYYYIPAKKLQPYHPLVLNHYRGPLMIVVPYADWVNLINEMISVEDYAEKSTWNFGYYWGGGSMLGGVHWQPFEKNGIHEKEKIERYLTILSCRTKFVVSGHFPTKSECEACKLAECPFCQFDKHKEEATGDIKEVDDRIALYKVAKRMVYNRWGLKATHCLNHDGNSICLYPDFKKDTVVIYLPTDVLIDIMNHPGWKDVSELAHSMPMQIGVPSRYEDYRLIKGYTVDVADDMSVEEVYEIWKNECPNSVISWFSEQNEKEADTSRPDADHDLGIVERIKMFFNKLPLF